MDTVNLRLTLINLLETSITIAIYSLFITLALINNSVKLSEQTALPKSRLET